MQLKFQSEGEAYMTPFNEKLLTIDSPFKEAFTLAFV